MRRISPLPAAAAACILLLSGCGERTATPPVSDPTPATVPQFVGSTACRDCHSAEFDDWTGSDHQRAMQIASDDTVLGDFSGAEFKYFGETTRFYRENGQFMIRTESADGTADTFRVSGTFGVTPLQQYLIDFPDGRKQAFPIAWDTRPKDQGGQRWYHLYPDETIGPGDPLNWRKVYLNWNYACAECHSTDLKPNYAMDTDSFATTYAEISVGCEACHGPGSEHARQARSGPFANDYGLGVDLDDEKDADWVMDAGTGIAIRSAPAVKQVQPEACGRCHSRHSVLTLDYSYGRPLADTHLPALLEEELYFPDGRMKDEVYVYGSFLQSRMYGKGVTCTDCHNPHAADLLTAPDRNGVCARCHSPARFSTTQHSGTASTDCVGCHMPARTYMGVDVRYDHSFRIPGDGASQPDYGVAIAAARAGPANDAIVAELKARDDPAIARATLLELLTPTDQPAVLDALAKGLADPDPLVRIGALRALRNFPSGVRLEQGTGLLADDIRGVRVAAAQTYVDLRDLLPVEAARAFPGAADDFREARLATASVPGSLTMLAEFESQLGDEGLAQKYLRQSVRIDPGFAMAHHSLGLLLAREHHYDEALDQLRAAWRLDPENGRFAYVLAVALNSTGHADEAVDLLEDAQLKFPDNFDIGAALATVLRDAGRLGEAREVARDLANRFPENPNARALLDSLQSQGS
jgi:predicted CXXCH cytochrome family protein